MDHIAGLDDLRRFNGLMKQAIHVYAHRATAAVLRQVFPYAFRNEYASPEIPSLILHEVAYGKPFSAGGMTFTPLRLEHGREESTGFLFSSCAYCTDISGIPAETVPLLTDLELLTLGALRTRPHPKHFSFSEADRAVGSLAPEKAFFTHIGHDCLHSESASAAKTPFASDGLSVTV
jgi:phosphoribosyl 1,2-cyclic phosphate phosphodiesterase